MWTAIGTKNLDNRDQPQYHDAGKKALVDDPSFFVGICWILQDVHGNCPEICGKDSLPAGRKGIRIQGLQFERLPDHCIYDFPGVWPLDTSRGFRILSSPGSIWAATQDCSLPVSGFWSDGGCQSIALSDKSEFLLVWVIFIYRQLPNHSRQKYLTTRTIANLTWSP